MPGIITSSRTASTRCAPTISSARGAAVGGEHLVAAARQPARQRVPVHRVVVDQQQRGVRLIHRACLCGRVEQPVHLLQQAGEVDRLGVEVVAAGVERLLAIADHGVRGQGDDRDVAAWPDRPSGGARTPSRRCPAGPGPSGSGRARCRAPSPAHAGRRPPVAHVVAAARSRRDSTSRFISLSSTIRIMVGQAGNSAPFHRHLRRAALSRRGSRCTASHGVSRPPSDRHAARAHDGRCADCHSGACCGMCGDTRMPARRRPPAVADGPSAPSWGLRCGWRRRGRPRGAGRLRQQPRRGGAGARAVAGGEPAGARRGRPTLVMLAHPRCTCTRASVGELAELMARAPRRPKAYVVFIKPGRSAPGGWERTDLWDARGRASPTSR